MLLLNYKPVLDQPTGIGVYANAILPALTSFEHFLIPGGGSGGGKERLNRLAWSQVQLPRIARERKADLIFTPAPEGYIGAQVVPQVVMVHDLRPLSHPECSMQSIYFKFWVPKLLKQCKHILTNSKFTSLEIQRAIGVSPEKVLTDYGRTWGAETLSEIARFEGGAFTKMSCSDFNRKVVPAQELLAAISHKPKPP